MNEPAAPLPLWPPPGAVLTRDAHVPAPACARATAAEERFVLAGLALTLAMVNALGATPLVLAVSTLQAAWAVALIRHPGRAVRALGTVGALALLAVWVTGHAVGLPLSAAGPRPIAALDVLGLALELTLLALLCGRRVAGAARWRRVAPTLHPLAFALAAALLSVAIAGHHASGTPPLDRFGFPVASHVYCGVL